MSPAFPCVPLSITVSRGYYYSVADPKYLSPEGTLTVIFFLPYFYVTGGEDNDRPFPWICYLSASSLNRISYILHSHLASFVLFSYLLSFFFIFVSVHPCLFLSFRLFLSVSVNFSSFVFVVHIFAFSSLFWVFFGHVFLASNTIMKILWKKTQNSGKWGNLDFCAVLLPNLFYRRPPLSSNNEYSLHVDKSSRDRNLPAQRKKKSSAFCLIQCQVTE